MRIKYKLYLMMYAKSDNQGIQIIKPGNAKNQFLFIVHLQIKYIHFDPLKRQKIKIIYYSDPNMQKITQRVENDLFV